MAVLNALRAYHPLKVLILFLSEGPSVWEIDCNCRSGFQDLSVYILKILLEGCMKYRAFV
jgi:hypothetical protein